MLGGFITKLMMDKAAKDYAKNMSRPGGAVVRLRKDRDADAFYAGAQWMLQQWELNNQREQAQLASTRADAQEKE